MSHHDLDDIATDLAIAIRRVWAGEAEAERAALDAGAAPPSGPFERRTWGDGDRRTGPNTGRAV